MAEPEHAADWQFHPGVEIGLIMSACLLKLSCSSDDLAWLTPFLVQNKMLALAYLFAMECVVALAIAVSWAGTEILDTMTEEGDYWNTERILGTASAICLSLFACLLFWEYLYDNDDDDDEESITEDDPNGPDPIEVDAYPKRGPSVKTNPVLDWTVKDVYRWWKEDLPAMAQAQRSFVKDCDIDGRDLAAINIDMLIDTGMQKLIAKKVVNEIDRLFRVNETIEVHGKAGTAETLETPLTEEGKQDQKKSGGRSSKFTPGRVITVTIMNSFDDMAIQASVLKGGDMWWYQLAIGIGLGACIVITICMFLSSIPWVKTCLEKVPVFAIVACFAAYSWVCTFMG